MVECDNGIIAMVEERIDISDCQRNISICQTAAAPNIFLKCPDRVAVAVRSDVTYEIRPVAGPMTFIDIMCHYPGLNVGLVGSACRIEKQGADLSGKQMETPLKA